MKGRSLSRCSHDIGEHDGAADRNDIDIAEQLSFSHVGKTKSDVFAAVGKTHIMA